MMPTGDGDAGLSNDRQRRPATTFVIVFVAVTVASSLLIRFLADRFPAEPSLSPAPPPTQQQIIADANALAFDDAGRFNLTGTVESSAVSYVDAIRVESFDDVIVLQVVRPERVVDDGRDLRLVVSSAGRFVEARPRSMTTGAALLVLRPALLTSLCGSAPCRVTVTVHTDRTAPLQSPAGYVLSGVRARLMRADRPVSQFLAGDGRAALLAVQTQRDGADVVVDGACAAPVFVGAIGETDLKRDRGTLLDIVDGRPGIQADHYRLRVGHDLFVIAVRSKAPCVVKVDVRSGAIARRDEGDLRPTWSWTFFGRTLILAVVVFCLVMPTVVMLFAFNRPAPASPADIAAAVAMEDHRRRRNQSALGSFPAVRVRPEDRLRLAFGEENRCSICLDVYAVGDMVRDLACAHRFHMDCCDSWIIDKGQCPLCLQDVGSAVDYHRRQGRRQQTPTRTCSLPMF